MKKTLVAAAFLSLLFPVAVTAATVSAKSSNCTVITCDLKVWDVPDVQGVALAWTPSFEGATYEIYRDTTYIGFQKFPAYTALDKGAEYGKIYTYTVKVKGTTLVGTIRCQRSGTGTTPVITSLVAADLWLEGEGPYNIQFTINDYDEARCTIKKLYFSVDGKTINPFVNSGDKKITGTQRGNLYSLGARLSKHGEKEVCAWIEYDDTFTGKTESGKRNGQVSKCVAKCYFHKYDGPRTNPNWYKYWEKDNAVPGLKGFSFATGSSTTAGMCTPIMLFSDVVKYDISDSGYFSIDGKEYKYPYVKKRKNIAHLLEIFPGAAAAIYSITLPNGNTIGCNAVGVRACASICKHEREHEKTSIQLHRGRFFERESDTISASALAALESFVTRANCPSRVSKYYDELILSRSRSNWSVDTDDDGVLDFAEEGLYGMENLGLSVGKSDTKKVSDAKWYESETGKWYTFAGTTKSKYKDKGDDEYLSRKAEEHFTVYTKNDWAFPGSKIASDYQRYPQKAYSSNGHRYEGWETDFKSAQQTRLQNTYSGNSKKSNGENTKSLLTSKLYNSEVLQGVDEDYESVCDAIDELPSLELDSLTKTIQILNVDEGKVIGSGPEEYHGLAFSVDVSAEGSETNDVVITGWLVDSEARPVARSQVFLNGFCGRESIEIVFPSSIIYKQGGTGYSLKYLTVCSAMVNGRQDIFDAKMDAADSAENYAAKDFAPAKGYLLSNEGITENKLGDLRLTVPIEVCSNGVYQLSATLKTESGDYVAESLATNITEIGAQEVALVFSGRDVFLSKCDGPYVVYKLELRTEDGEYVDSEWDAYTTAAYSYRDFADGSETIFADTGSFRREADLVGADGLCDALNFSFVVTNLAPSEVEYVARIYLCGTNDELVCSSTKNVVLSNEVNAVTVPFRGIDIKKRGVEGPYYVSEVTIEDAESGETVERFKPEQILINRMLSEFGDAPVALDGEVSLDKGTDEIPFVVQVPVSAVRPGVVRVSAILVSTNGTPVASAKATKRFASGEGGVLTLSFNAADINQSGVRGPYMVKYLVLASDYEGVDEVHVDDPGLGVLEKEFILYVDASKEDDSGDGLTLETAKATIQGAVKVAQPGDTILVADGVYEPVMCGVAGVKIRSMNGPAVTIIDGQRQLLCVRLWANGTEYYDEEEDEWYYIESEYGNPVIEGFTLRNGWTQEEGAGIYGGTARNCIITGCHSCEIGGGAAYAILENCVLYGNTSVRSGSGAYDCELYSCTVSANKANEGAGGIAYSYACNSIVYGNVGGNEAANEYDSDTASNGSAFDYSCTLPLPTSGEGNIEENPLLVDPAHGDARLRSTSPCIDAASLDFDLAELDIYGNPRVQGDAPEMGAVEGNFEDRICVSASVRGVGTVSPLSALVAPGGSVTFTASSDSREFMAFEIGGKRVSTSPVFTLENVKADVSIVAVFKPGVYYVRTDGADDNSGLDWAHAKASIQGALDVCEDGETIYVESGAYAPFDSNNRRVTIRSMFGAAETIIDAKGVGSCAFMGGDYGETNTVLVGFTLQNGKVGGAGGGARGGTLVDCRIINNQAGECGGGLYCSTASRCIISNNSVVASVNAVADNPYYYREYYGGGAYGGVLDNCLVNNNTLDVRENPNSYCRGGGTCGSVLYNCTVTKNAIWAAQDEIANGDNDDDNDSYDDDDDDETGRYGGGCAGGSAYNTIIWGNSVNDLVDDALYVNKHGCLDDGVDPMFEDGCFTLSADSPCIDSGDDSCVVGGVDVSGNRRIVGDRVDIGAYEFSQETEVAGYEIVFVPNGGNGDMECQAFTFGERQSLSKNAFARNGYVFAGWSLTEAGNVVYLDGQQIYNLASQPGERIELYAQWLSVAAGSCPESPVRFPMSASLATYNVSLARAWLDDIRQYGDDRCGALFCETTVERGGVYTIAVPAGQEFAVWCDDVGAVITYSTFGALRICRVDAGALVGETAVLHLGLFGDVGHRTTVYALAADYNPAGAVPEIDGSLSGSCAERSLPFAFGSSVSTYNVSLVRAKAWMDEERRIGPAFGCGVLHCRAAIARGGVYTIAVPIAQEFLVLCDDDAAVVEYAVQGSLKFCRIDMRGALSETASVELVLFGDIGARTTVYAVASDYIPAGTEVSADPIVADGSCPEKPGQLRFEASVLATPVRLGDEWDAAVGVFRRYGVHYLAAVAVADGCLTVAVPLAQAGGCVVACADRAVVSREDFGALSLWIFDAKAGDEVSVKLSGARGADVVVYTFGGDYLAKRLFFEAEGGTCAIASKDVRIGKVVGVLPVPEWKGHLFDGWYTARAGGARVTEATPMVGYDVTLYAHWENVAAGACEATAIGFAFGQTVAVYPVALAKEWLEDEERYEDVSGILYCRASVTRGKVYTVALPAGQDFEVRCGDAGAVVAYATYGTLRYCRIDARNLVADAAEIVLSAFGRAGDRTTVYVIEGDLVPADAEYEGPGAGELPGSHRDRATELGFAAAVQAKSVRLVRAWDEGEKRYLDGGVHYLRAAAPFDGTLTVAVPLAQADGCEVSCAGNAVAREEYAGLAVWIFDAQEGDEVIARLAGTRGKDITVYTFGGDFLAKRLIFDPNGGTCPVASKDVRAGVPVGELPTATLAGSTFQGWFTAREGGARVTEATVMVNYDVTLYAHWERLVPGSSQEAAVPFAMTASVAAYQVSLAREWLEDELKYSDIDGAFYCKTTLRRGQVYTMAVPKGLDQVNAWCVNGEASVAYGSDASLQYVRFDTTQMAADETEAYFAVFDEAGRRTTIYAVEADLMPKDCTSCIDTP